MSVSVNPQPIQKNAAAQPKAVPSQAKGFAKFKQANSENTLLFDKENYKWMLGGIALIVIGFILMAGGKSANPHEFHYDEIYSFRRITLAPIVILLGFGIEIYAIMKKPKE